MFAFSSFKKGGRRDVEIGVVCCDIYPYRHVVNLS